MKNNKLEDFEIEELEFMIPEIENMYNFKFDKDECYTVNNFEELCDLIIKKINLTNVDSCTSQQTFYRLRNAFIKEKLIEKEKLNTETELKIIFPRKKRKTLIKQVEKEMKFKFDIIKAPDFITMPLLIIGLISFFLLFFIWKLGILGIVISVFGHYLCKWFGNELKIKNMKELVEKIISENYLKVRTEKNTINRTELKKVLTYWFSEKSGIKKEKLKSATFV